MGAKSIDKIAFAILDKTPRGREIRDRIFDGLRNLKFEEIRVSFSSDDDASYRVCYSFPGYWGSQKQAWTYIEMYELNTNGDAYRLNVPVYQFMDLDKDHLVDAFDEAWGKISTFNVGEKKAREHFCRNPSEYFTEHEVFSKLHQEARARVTADALAYIRRPEWPQEMALAKNEEIVRKIKTQLVKFRRSASDELIQRAVAEFLCDCVSEE